MGILSRISVLAVAGCLLGCITASHPVTPSPLGQGASTQAMEALLSTPGSMQFERVVAARWEADLKGLVNLKHPKAKADGLKNQAEPIEIYFYALRHPSRGLFLVDTGVSRGLAERSPNSIAGTFVGRQAGLDKLNVHVDTATWLSRAGAPVAGVFLTHIHLDHILGLPDIPPEVPVYLGPGETKHRALLNMFVQGITDDHFAGRGALQELKFSPDASGEFAGVLDVFGDGQFFALHVPGHTPGSMAFVARTTQGPVLLTGDACHTAYGWQNQVEPGTFSADIPQSVGALKALHALAQRHPTLHVHLGHQALSGGVPTRSLQKQP